MVATITRSSDNSISSSAMADMARTSKAIEEAYRRITTGNNMSSFRDAGEQTSRILGLETKLSGLTDYEQGETTVASRMQKMEVVVRQINEMAVDYRARINKAVSYGVVDTAFQDYCQKQLTAVQKLLNTQDAESRYLFGGEATTTPPVDTSQMPVPGLGSPIDYSYYKGSNTKTSALIGENQLITYGLTANEPGFAKLINAFMIGATTAPNNDANSIAYQKLHTDAMNLLEQVSSDIPDTLQSMGTTMKLVEQSQDRQNSLKTFTQELLSDMTTANYVDSIFELNKAQLCLQFSVIAHQKMSENLDDLLSALRNM